MIHSTTLGASDGPPVVEVEIGRSCYCRYKLALYDRQGKNPMAIGAGQNREPGLRRFAIGDDPFAMHGRFLSCSANAVPGGGSYGTWFNLTIHVRQLGLGRLGSPIQVERQLPGPHAEVDFARLNVV